MDLSQEEINSRVLRAGRRTYFFDVRETKASDYYLTITESKKFTNEDGSFIIKNTRFIFIKKISTILKKFLGEMMDFIIAERGDEVISDSHQKDYKKEKKNDFVTSESSENFTDLEFDDI